MRTFYTLATIGLLSVTASAARAQLPGSADRALEGAARADVNADDRASEAVNIERGRLSRSSDPAAHVSTNPNAANLDANARAAANVPRANADGIVGIAGDPPVADPNRWRYVRHNNQWWYYSPNNTWMYHRDNIWNNYNATTYTQPQYSTGYRGYGNNQYTNRRYNYSPGVRARANVNAGGAINGGPVNNVLPGAGVGAGVGAGLGVRGR
jgi:hypothetical protein